MMGNKVIYQHYRPEEHHFIEKMLDIISQVESYYAFQVTDFLNPREVDILKNLVGQGELKVFSSSDYYDTEYARVIIAPNYYELNIVDFEIGLLECTYNTKFNQISHRQVLGTVINHLGVKRSVIGDILLGEGIVQILVDQSMSSYLAQMITKIGRVSVNWYEVDFGKLLPRYQKGKSMEILVSSWRIDGILSDILNLSRNSAVKLLEKDKVRLNYASISKVSQELEVGDLLSVRGHGRFVISSYNGLTKSGKYKLTIEKIIET